MVQMSLNFKLIIQEVSQLVVFCTYRILSLRFKIFVNSFTVSVCVCVSLFKNSSQPPSLEYIRTMKGTALAI